MKRRGVAAVLSAVVFPGVGQYYMGRKARALLFVIVAAAAGLVYLNFEFDAASAVTDQLLSGNLTADPAALEAKIAAIPTPLYVTLAGIVFLLCWVGSIVEVYLVPKS